MNGTGFRIDYKCGIAVAAGLLALAALALGASLLVSCVGLGSPAPTPTKTRSVALVAIRRATLVQATRVTYTPRPTLVRSTPRPTASPTEPPPPAPILPTPAPATLPAATETPALPGPSAPAASSAAPGSTPTLDLAAPTATPSGTPTLDAAAPTATPSGTPTLDAAAPTVTPSGTPTLDAAMPTTTASGTATVADATRTAQPSAMPSLTSTPTATGTPPATATGVARPDTPSFYVYMDGDAADNHFSTNDMPGDVQDITWDMWYPDNPCHGDTSIQVQYTPGDPNNPNAMAGMQWLEKEGVSATANDGYDLRNYNRLVLCARGERGDERVKFGMGGSGRDAGCAVQEPYPDSSCGMTLDVTLSDHWQEYTIDLSRTDLSRVIDGFFWEVRASPNPDGATFYVDEIRYEHR